MECPYSQLSLIIDLQLRMYYSSDHVIVYELTEIEVQIIMSVLTLQFITNGLPILSSHNRKSHITLYIGLVDHWNPFTTVGWFKVSVYILFRVSVYETMESFSISHIFIHKQNRDHLWTFFQLLLRNHYEIIVP